MLQLSRLHLLAPLKASIASGAELSAPDTAGRSERLSFVQVVRGPFDMIATMILRTRRSFDSAFLEYLRNWDAAYALQERLSADDLWLSKP